MVEGYKVREFIRKNKEDQAKFFSDVWYLFTKKERVSFINSHPLNMLLGFVFHVVGYSWCTKILHLNTFSILSQNRIK